MDVNKNESPLKVFFISAEVPKVGVTKLWVGVDTCEKNAIREVVAELLQEFDFLVKEDVIVSGICFLRVESVIRNANIVHNRMNKYSGANFPLYKKEEKIIEKFVIGTQKRESTKDKKNSLMKEIIENKDKHKFKNNKKKFNKAEQKYICDSIN